MLLQRRDPWEHTLSKGDPDQKENLPANRPDSHFGDRYFEQLPYALLSGAFKRQKKGWKW